MRIALTAIFLLLTFILQMALREVGFYVSLMNLSLCYLCVLLVHYKTEDVLWMALGAGIFMDIFSGTPDGVIAISLPVAVKLADYLGNTFFSERLHTFLIPSYAFTGTLGFIITGLLVLWVMSLLGWVYPPDTLYYLTWLLPISIAFNLLGLIPAYFLNNLENIIQKRYIPKHESI